MSSSSLEDENKTKRASFYDGLFDCPACLQIYHNPILQTSCGHRFCRDCVHMILNNQSQGRCPVDGNKIDPDRVFTDTAFERQIASVHIVCCYSSNGCDWEGNIQSLQEHRDECQFVDILCPRGCGAKLTKSLLDYHICRETIACGSCAMEIDAANIEAHECPLESRPGPEGQPSKVMPDEEPFINQDMSRSSNDSSSLKQRCRFHKIGCSFRGNRFEVDLHMDVASENHLDIVCKAVEEIKTGYIKKENKVISKHDNRIKMLQDYICKQNVVIMDLRETNRRLETTSRTFQTRIDEMSQQTETLIDEISRLKIRCNLFNEELCEAKDTNYTGSLLWKIKNVSEEIKKAVNKTQISLYSQPFYTSRYGYKLRAQLFLNGLGFHTGNFVSIYFHLLPSQHDDILKWPFSHKITFSLLEQTDDIESARNISYTLVPSPEEDNFKRPSHKMSDGQGKNKFVSLEQLRKGEYIKNDCLFIKIRVHCKGACKKD